MAPAPDRGALEETRVRVGAVRKECTHERHAGAGIVVRDAAVAQRPPEHRRVQRRVAERRRVRIGPLGEQERGQRSVPAVRRDVEDRIAVGRRVVHVRAGGNQQARRFEIARPCGEQQRGAPAQGHLLECDAARRRSGGTAAAHVVDPAPRAGAGVDVRTVLEQRPRDRRMPVRHGPHQGRLAAGALGGVNARAGGQQGVGRLQTPRPRRRHQRRLPAGKRPVRIGAGRQQALDEHAVPAGARHQERRHAEIVRRVDVGPRANQEVGDLHVLPVHRPMERRGAVRLPRIHIDRTGQQFPYAGNVHGPHGRDQR